MRLKAARLWRLIGGDAQSCRVQLGAGMSAGRRQRSEAVLSCIRDDETDVRGAWRSDRRTLAPGGHVAAAPTLDTQIGERVTHV